MPEQRDYQKFLTPANVVTALRITFIPVFVLLILAPWPDWAPDPQLAAWVKPWVAAVVDTLRAVTDSVDGYLARSRNEVTNLGKFLDPLADKILVAAAMLALIELGKLPSWIALIILTREFLVSGLRMVASAEGKVIAASMLGKVKTVFQIIAMVCFIVKDSSGIESLPVPLPFLFETLSWLVMTVALILTLLSLIDYFRKSSDVLGIPQRGGED
ncbi:MAG: CDP-diacylglycerol--glycerol-3-phosphate 3-phosphatidyltransferase [Coriobacteriales bacterium]|jgi:CDP-diacylglycerol--glycerol-3-phosphate 3-phosphatidyltransferase|nr:CDP-diacylglycerol--glycerol-3-phosphate 3-phosphatidyltransferase [Coriobacteriales bacterium]